MKKLNLIIFILFVCLPRTGLARDEAMLEQFNTRHHNSSYFIENKGQWLKEVKFLARDGGLNSGIYFVTAEINGKIAIENNLLIIK